MKASKTSFSCSLDMPFEEAVQKVKQALQSEGFGVITEIDIKDVIKKKLNTDFRKYLILGACNPHYALDALSKDVDVGLLLPCNVIVYEENNETIVSAINPSALLQIIGKRSSLESIAAETGQMLQNVIKLVEAK